MDQLRELFERLTLAQKITLAVVILGVSGGIYSFVQWNHERDFRPLFSNLAPEDAGQILARLRERGIEFRTAEPGTAVLVPASLVAELRMELAAEGLPRTGRIGFELFDKSNFAITDFQEQVNYHRALEGEIERSIMSIGAVEQARVHITFAKDSLFAESRQAAKASVVVKLRPGAQLAAQNVQAITNLTASAVENLQPESVTVIDMRGNLLNRSRKPLLSDGSEPSDAQIEYRQQVERDLVSKIRQQLEGVVQPDHFRAAVYADIDFTSGEQSEEVFDPSRSVMTSQQRTEDVSGAPQSTGVPGTASNLPRPTSRPGESSRGVARRTENVMYQSTRSIRRTRLPQGAIKRISVSLVVDHDLRWEGTGDKAKRVVEPPPPEKLKKISDLVSAAVGLQTQRGDQLLVDSLPFDLTLTAPPPPPAPVKAPAVTDGIPWPAWIPEQFRNIAVLGGIGAGILLAIAGGAFFLFRGRKGGKGGVQNVGKQGELSGKAKAAAAMAAAQSSAPNVPAKSVEQQLEEASEKQRQSDAQALADLKLPQAVTKKGELLAKHIAEEARKDPIAIAHLLRSWLQEDGLTR